MIKTVGEKMIINVGSVGLNFDKNESAQYMIIEHIGKETNFTIRKVPYDYTAFKKACDTEDVWVKLCLKSIEDGVNYNMAFLEEAQTHCHEWPIPNEIWVKMADEWTEKGII